MAASYIQVAADGSGKKMQTVVNTVGADSVHAEVVTLADTSGAAITTLPVSAVSLPLPSAAATSTIQSDGSQKTQIVDGSGNVIASTGNALDGNLKTLNGTIIDVNMGNVSAGSQRVVIGGASTPSQSSVANNTGNVTLLFASSSRLGATIFNDDTAGTGATLKVKLGTTASATSFTIAIAPQGYYEVPFNYTGRIDAIASAGTGSARITEIVA